MADNLCVIELTQTEADKWLKTMFTAGGELLENLKKAFHEEKNNEPPNALSEEKRKYYMVYANNCEELLAGVNSMNCDISSLAKVVPKDRSKATGRDCVRKLIEIKVVDECRKIGRDSFSVAMNKDGKRIFEYLMNNLPQGIRRVSPQKPFPYFIEGQNEYYYYPFVLYIDNQK